MTEDNFDQEILSAQDIPDEGEMVDVTPQEPQPEIRFYFLGAVKIVYVRQKALKERTVNVMLDLITPAITQQVLTDMNRAAMGRVMQEMKLKVTDIREAVCMGISFLGQMTKEDFTSRNIPSAVTDTIDLGSEDESSEDQDPINEVLN